MSLKDLVKTKLRENKLKWEVPIKKQHNNKKLNKNSPDIKVHKNHQAPNKSLPGHIKVSSENKNHSSKENNEENRAKAFHNGFISGYQSAKSEQGKIYKKKKIELTGLTISILNEFKNAKPMLFKSLYDDIYCTVQNTCFDYFVKNIEKEKIKVELIKNMQAQMSDTKFSIKISKEVYEKLKKEESLHLENFEESNELSNSDMKIEFGDLELKLSEVVKKQLVNLLERSIKL